MVILATLFHSLLGYNIEVDEFSKCVKSQSIQSGFSFQVPSLLIKTALMNSPANPPLPQHYQ